MTIKEEIKNLFLQKRFSEIIFLIESKFEEKTPEILNILAISRLSQQRSREIYKQSLSEFEEAYLKDKNSQDGLNALINYLNAAADLDDYLGHQDTSNFSKFFLDQSVKFFKEAENKFGYNPKLILLGIRIFKRLNQLDTILIYYKKLFDKNDLNLLTFTSWIFFNNYKTYWNQKDYFKFTKLLDSHIPNAPNEKLINLSNKKNDKIKIGFLSSDINKSHSITFFLKTICASYNKKEFELYLFLNHKIEDEGVKNFKKLVDGIFNVSNLDDIEAINFIRKKNIDITFDIMGLSSSNRIALFKNRISPIQISWLGYCNTLGIKSMDYLIADPNLIYKNELDQYSEKVLFLPNIWNCHNGFEFSRQEYPTPVLKNNYITFGSFNNFNKINSSVVKIWSNILKKIPNSKLIIKSPTKKDIDYLENLFDTNNVKESISCLPPEKEFINHLNLYEKIDIALDTFPWNGVTTSFESIWMGVPVVTMKGYNFNSRCGESINRNIKMEELIASDEDDYIKKAVNLATNKNYLVSIRKKIYNEAITSPLFNVDKFSKDFFNLLKKL
jgi:predicted O-linked N-acetylglucosamine transferase (SPINDLY family)